jgi:hypothetical protein
MVKKSKKKIVLVNKGKRGHILEGVALHPGSNKISEQDFSKVQNKIKEIEEAGREETADILKRELDLKNVVNVNEEKGQSKYNFESIGREKLKSLIKETFSEKELVAIKESAIEDGKYSKSIESALEAQLEFIKKPIGEE